MKNTTKKYHVIGLMSGTSLDGLDIAHCSFSFENKKWNYKILEGQTIKYNAKMYKALDNAFRGTSDDIAAIHSTFGHYCGKEVAKFIAKHSIKNVDFIASHGHTIFHQPKKHYTLQIGNGAAIAAETSLPVVCDFRSKDIALGGQGAPLVPIGDFLLFSEYDLCLNIGGFANISNAKTKTAYDVCAANIVLNELSLKLNKPFDKNGNIAKKGQINDDLLQKLNELPFFKQKNAKSLGKEWVEKNIKPIFKTFPKESTENLIATFTEHLAIQIIKSINDAKAKKVIISGGGTFNTYLIEKIKQGSNAEITIPLEETIAFKEALIFAFLGVLRWEGKANCLKSVTGAKIDNIGGAVYL